MKDFSKVLFITDMDGTLLTSDKKLNPKDLYAIAELRFYGGHFAIATGRAVQSAAQYFDELKLEEPIILCNGGGIYDCKQQKFVWQRFVDTSLYDTVKTVFDKFPDIGGEVCFSNDILVPRMNEMERYHLNISYFGKYKEVDYADIPKDGWCKMLFAGDEETIPHIADYISELGNDKAEYVRSSKIFYEILPKNCTKGKALKELRELYHMDDWTIVACGDFDNDLEMIQAADIGFAPSNAQEIIKAEADYVTKADCSNGAVAEALEYMKKIL